MAVVGVCRGPSDAAKAVFIPAATRFGAVLVAVTGRKAPHKLDETEADDSYVSWLRAGMGFSAVIGCCARSPGWSRSPICSTLPGWRFVAGVGPQ
ncbi:hypothetical protein [Amycolatopsis magusensis]|uniref:Uncharacterized protein n=1 Tax=Amycolatopsis magusensis TaxID=882444 RepID=A0ABS4Q4N4_9PSEU|nr:hypothetical protein [Amycolatopsis magusensis]MBP2186068.1 hypothetical protein [Amycolatopsis magusensis]